MLGGVCEEKEPAGQAIPAPRGPPLFYFAFAAAFRCSSLNLEERACLQAACGDPQGLATLHPSLCGRRGSVFRTQHGSAINTKAVGGLAGLVILLILPAGIPKHS